MGSPPSFEGQNPFFVGLHGPEVVVLLFEQIARWWVFVSFSHESVILSVLPIIEDAVGFGA